MYSAVFESIKDRCALCRQCPLHEERLNIVFGTGAEDADILFVGDMPRGKDDIKGLPLTGKEGELFEKFLTLCDMDAEKNVFITNILKCRPAVYDVPDDSCYEACMEHLRCQVRHIKPKIIVCLGSEAAKRMIDPAFNIDKRHGSFIKKGKLFFIATYHPSEIIDNEDKRLSFLSDFQKLRESAAQGGII